MKDTDNDLFKKAISEGLSRKFQETVDKSKDPLAYSEQHKKAMSKIISEAKNSPKQLPSK